VTPGVQYYYKVSCNNSATSQECLSELSGPEPGHAGTLFCPLPTPTGLSASDGSYSDRVHLSWNPVSGATWYNLYRATNPDGEYTNFVTIGSTSWNDTAVTPGVQYYYKVSCNNSATSQECLSEPSGPEPGHAAAADCPLPTPTGLRATDGAYSDRVRLSWNPVSGATWYNLYRATSPDGEYTNFVTIGSTSWNDTAVTPGVQYYYKVSCNNSATSQECLSALSGPEPGQAEAVDCPLPAPTGIAASAGTYGDRILIEWHSVAGATWYNVYRAETVEGPYVNIVTTGGTSWEDFDVTPGMDYLYKVSSNNSATSQECLSDLSDSADGFALAAECPLPVPGNLVATEGAFPDRVHLQWDSVAGAIWYNVYRATTLAGPYTNLITVAALGWEDETVLPGVEYLYRVSCNNSATSQECLSDLSPAAMGYSNGAPEGHPQLRSAHMGLLEREPCEAGRALIVSVHSSWSPCDTAAYLVHYAEGVAHVSVVLGPPPPGTVCVALFAPHRVEVDLPDLTEGLWEIEVSIYIIPELLETPAGIGFPPDESAAREALRAYLALREPDCVLVGEYAVDECAGDK
jgi:fibronectin type 3 domain-containing protein